MRNGILVEEGAPQDIISKHEADSLESAFLTLCSYQDTNEVPKVYFYINIINTFFKIILVLITYFIFILLTIIILLLVITIINIYYNIILICVARIIK